MHSFAALVYLSHLLALPDMARPLLSGCDERDEVHPSPGPSFVAHWPPVLCGSRVVMLSDISC